ncbi:hypothetical protein GCM10011583_11640 [Streptomyces camponoticapitis]|uniref:Uncharacterized protein n=1 Tax=Streptomyces camponoticapitis TaxID=1616125 RepID=A0ABQ2DZE6_9ACTN|nr:hypothetical protein [Streptomyces camponoticapitis]GGJ81853.1 hypothetical protein GCM10011583_11640 [Streptomyces camponoticapitis]
MTERARTHIKAIVQELKDAATPGDESTAAVFVSGMLAGLAISVQILDGQTAEQAMQQMVGSLETAVGKAYLDGTLPAPGSEKQDAGVDWEAVVRRREIELKTVGDARHRAEDVVARARALCITWRATSIPLGTSISRWWDARLVELSAALDPVPETCCVCGGPGVVYHNYREQPFCWECADCGCNQDLCVRTDINKTAPVLTTDAAPDQSIPLDVQVRQAHADALAMMLPHADSYLSDDARRTMAHARLNVYRRAAETKATVDLRGRLQEFADQLDDVDREGLLDVIGMPPTPATGGTAAAREAVRIARGHDAAPQSPITFAHPTDVRPPTPDEAAIERVRTLHRPADYADAGMRCAGCCGSDPYVAPTPGACPTLAALDGPKEPTS